MDNSNQSHQSISHLPTSQNLNYEAKMLQVWLTRHFIWALWSLIHLNDWFHLNLHSFFILEYHILSSHVHLFWSLSSNLPGEAANDFDLVLRRHSIHWITWYAQVLYQLGLSSYFDPQISQRFSTEEILMLNYSSHHLHLGWKCHHLGYLLD